MKLIYESDESDTAWKMQTFLILSSSLIVSFLNNT